ncbi:MAG TPA: KpsF/GutQ family sugar-phosphate isomerase [Chthoniobacteraceae bacterium]|nr:KpsF/GutQ family sugar-phosphate isomerase [Chthoniobacteraceae bacterium]
MIASVSASHHYIAVARAAINAQAKALGILASRVGDEFTRAVERILACRGRVVISGAGKSGIIGRKIAATFASTGTPSLFLHPGDAFHGDLGMVTVEDLVILISYSGETEEIIRLISSFKASGNEIIALSRNSGSTVARHADLLLNIAVEREICPYNLAPTTSTLVTMAIGDALAIALMQARGFQPTDFVRYHPGGSLGRRLLRRVGDVMNRLVPTVSPDADFRECLEVMRNGRMGFVLVVEKGHGIKGIITDDDFRRLPAVRAQWPHSPLAAKMMAVPAVTINESASCHDAETLMYQRKVKVVIVTSDDGRHPVGVIGIPPVGASSPVL